MKNGLKTNVMLIALGFGCAAVAAEAKPKPEEAKPVGAKRFVNDICLPSNLWLLSDTANDLFVQPFLKRWRPYDDFVRFSLSGPDKPAFSRRLSPVATIGRPVDGSKLTVDLVNGDEFETVKRTVSTIRVGRKGVGDRDVYAQILGDSFTHGRFYQDALVESGYVPKLHLVGLLSGGGGQFNEGRGGAALATYFGVPTREIQFYHGFQQPDGYRYWGARAFWVMAWRCFRGTQPKGFEPTYSCSRYDACLPRFDEKTGVLLAPKAGDLQYDNAAKTFVAWDGTAWKSVDARSLKWSFDYAKYLAMWELKAPQFLFVLLGLNDFRGNLRADFTQWGERIRIVKESYLGAVPDGKFVICIPCSTCGSVDNASGDFTPAQNAAMWRFRDWLIKTFDRREKEGFHLLDAGISTDNDHGFNPARGTVCTPFEKAPATFEPLRVQTGNPHPYPNYPAMGLPFAAFIQYYR